MELELPKYQNSSRQRAERTRSCAGIPVDGRSVLEDLFKRWRCAAPISTIAKSALIGLPWTQATFGREAYVVREGEPTSSFTVLVSGFAIRQKLASDGRRQIVSLHFPGEFVDVQNCFLDHADCNIQALNSITVASVSKSMLLKLMAAHPSARRSIWLDSMVQTLTLGEWIGSLQRNDAAGRIAYLLCEFVARLRAAGMTDGTGCHFPMSQDQIADATGLTGVHTNRTLQALRKSGLIRLSSNRLEVLDWDALCEVGGFDEACLHRRNTAELKPAPLSHE